MYDCTFCRIIDGDLPATKVYEDDLSVAFMDIMPVNPGHVLIVPKRHFAELSMMDETTGAHLFQVAMRIEKAIRQTDLRCEGTNLLQNNGRSAMQEIMHVHLHIIPRYRGDSLRFGYALKRHSQEQLQEAADAIRERLA